MKLLASIGISASVALALLGTPVPAHGLPLHRASDGRILPIPNLWRTPIAHSEQFDFEGIVGLDDCSGSLVRFETSVDSDMAMILTNGHCNETGVIDAGKFIYGIASNRYFTLYDSGINAVGTLYASKIMYATMTGTDITLYQLGQTFAAIKSQYGIQPLTLASSHPQIGTPIEVESGYWSRGYACNIEQFVTHLKEGQWISDDSIRYSRPGCEVIAGTSGSPAIEKGTRTIIGINNTMNENGQKCTDDNPCEIDSNGNVTYTQGFGYAQETYVIYGCLNANREIDLQVAGCKLQH